MANLENNSPDFDVGLQPAQMIVLVGLMGAGKTTVGRRLAAAVNLPFYDADEEIENSAGRSVEDIFEDFGEAAFREGERKVIARLLSGPKGVLATGGGAFMNDGTRALIRQKGLSIWLMADLDVLMERVALRDTRPILRQANPRKIMQNLMDKRYPVYAKADIHIESGADTHGHTVTRILNAIKARQQD